MSKTANDIITASHVGSLVFDDIDVRQAQRLAYLESAIRKLVDKYEGVRNPLCGYLEASLGDSDVLVEYEYEPGEAAQTIGPPEKCYEGSDPVVSVGMVLINGKWSSTEDFHAEWLDRWEQEIIDQENAVARDQWESSFERGDE
jgi:hypothetical protein